MLDTEKLEKAYYSMPNKEAAEEMGVSVPTLLKMIDKAGIKRKGSGRPYDNNLPPYLLHSDNQEDIYSKELFLKNYKNHELEILKDDGLYRHLKLSNKSDPIEDLEITTSPGSLIVRSLMGVFAFERIDDMFDFFRDKDLNINAGYYEEKCINSPTINNGDSYSKRFIISLYAIVHSINLYDDNKTIKVVD